MRIISQKVVPVVVLGEFDDKMVILVHEVALLVGDFHIVVAGLVVACRGDQCVVLHLHEFPLRLVVVNFAHC